MLRIGGTPATYGCLKCWHKATCKCNSIGKTAYNNHRSLLPRGHPLRAPLRPLHNPSKAPIALNATSSLRYRSNREVAERLREPHAAPLLYPPERVRTFTAGGEARQNQDPGPIVQQQPPARRQRNVTRNRRQAGEYDSDDAESEGEGEGDQEIPAATMAAFQLNPFARLRYFNFNYMVCIDAMHTIGGVMKDLCKCFQGLRENANVEAYEANVNNRDFGDVHLACKWRTGGD